MTGRLLPVLFLSLAGCALSEARMVAEARRDMVGLRRADLYVCAGFPSRAERIDVLREIYSYELRGHQEGGLNLNLPVVGGLNLTGDAGYCRANFELIDGVVTRVGFSGDNDSPGAPEARCAPIIKSCLGMERSAQPKAPG